MARKKLSDFSIGDRVELARGEAQGFLTEGPWIGLKGTVCGKIPVYVSVCWDTAINGGHDCVGTCPYGYGWFVRPYEISRLDDENYRNITVSSTDFLSVL